MGRRPSRAQGIPFAKGTMYRRADWYTVHVFRSSNDPREQCFTDTRAGDNLPAASAGGKWRYRTTFSMALKGVVAFGVRPRELREEVKKRGSPYVRFQAAKSVLSDGILGCIFGRLAFAEPVETKAPSNFTTFSNDGGFGSRREGAK